MDSTTITQTVQTISVTHEVWGKLTPMLWFVLYLGLLCYWLSKLNDVKVLNADSGIGFIIRTFFKQNWIEIPLSLIGCLLFALFSDLPKSSMDSTVIMGMVFASGYGGSSIVNNIITQTKAKEGLVSMVKKKEGE